MTLNEFVCLTCGHSVKLHPDHPANARVHDGVVFRASCELCREQNVKSKRSSPI